MPLRDYCRHQAVTAAPSRTLREIAELMKRENAGSVVLVERDHPVGLLTDRDVALAVLARGRDPEKVAAKEIMSRPVVTVSEDAAVGQVGRLMRRNGLRRVPVVDDKGRIAGIVTSDDVLRLVSGELAALGHALDTQIPGHGSAPVVAG